MFYLMIGGFLVLLQLFLLFITPLNIYPEMFFYPWLVSKGLLPYRDFFDHHGFLLYYLLAPLTIDKSLFLIKLFYIAVQSMSLMFFLKILKKPTTKFVFILCGLLFIFLNYYLSDSNLWFETIITLFFVLIYYVFTLRKFTWRAHILGFLIALVSFVKPNAAIILLPVVWVVKDVRVIVFFIIPWMIVGLYFFLNHGLFQFVNSLFISNIYVGYYLRTNDALLIEKSFYIFSLFLLLVFLITSILNKKFRKTVPIILLMIFSLSFLLNGFKNVSLLPFIPFFIIYLGTVLKQVKFPYRLLLIITLVLFIGFLVKKSKHQYTYFYNKPTYIEKSKIEINRKYKTFYVVGNQVEAYYLSDVMPPTYFTIILPFMTKYFNAEERIISDLKSKKIDYILIPKPEDKNYIHLNKLNKFIKREPRS